MKRLFICILLFVYLVPTISVAESTVFPFLDEMGVSELVKLQSEVEKRLAAIKKASAAVNTDNMGIWTKKYYIDEFQMPTDDAYIVNSLLFSGTFSNSATTNSKLTAKMLVDPDGSVTLFLYEYGSNAVKNYYSSDRKYFYVYMMAPDGNKHLLDGFIRPSGDRLCFTSEESAIITDALAQNGTVRFSISESKGSDSYYFEIPDSSYFTNAFKAISEPK